MTSNFNNSLINYGDMYRIRKYYKVFLNWDTTKQKIVYPEHLTTEVY